MPRIKSFIRAVHDSPANRVFGVGQCWGARFGLMLANEGYFE